MKHIDLINKAFDYALEQYEDCDHDISLYEFFDKEITKLPFAVNYKATYEGDIDIVCIVFDNEENQIEFIYRKF